nr:MAG TPA: hypothetical protein [Caudoviricetes sp.]
MGVQKFQKRNFSYRRGRRSYIRTIPTPVINNRGYFRTFYSAFPTVSPFQALFSFAF